MGCLNAKISIAALDAHHLPNLKACYNYVIALGGAGIMLQNRN